VTEEGSLGRSVTRALGWSTLAQVLGRAGSFAVGIVLARLLTQEDFGAYAVTLVAVNLLIVFNDLGVIAAVIRWPGDVREAARTAATVSVVSSGAIFLLGCAAAGPFAAALGSPESATLVRVLLVVILIDGLSASHQAMLVRTFRNDRLALAELAGFAASTPLTVVLAVGGAGPWSIVAGRVAGAAVVALLVVRAAPFRIRPAFDRVLAGRLVRFGVPLAVSAIVAQAVLNVDYVVVGRELGTVELGIYLLAFNLSSWPATLVTTAVARVAFAGFSRLVEDRARLVVALPRSIGVALSALVPLVVVLVVLAPEVVRFLYGDRWLPAVTPLRFLVVLGGLRILIDLLADLSIADGRPAVALRVRAVWLAAAVPALAVGAAADGLRGVGIAHVAVAGLVVVPWLVADARRSGIAVGALGRQAVRPVVAGAAAAVAMLAVVPLFEATLLRLVVGGTVGGAAYLAALVPRNPLVPWVVSRVHPVPATP
jgi:PST family polysaccharide transporter